MFTTGGREVAYAKGILPLPTSLRSMLELRLSSLLRLNHKQLKLSKDILPSLCLSMGSQGTYLGLGIGEGVEPRNGMKVQEIMGIEVCRSSGEWCCRDSQICCPTTLDLLGCDIANGPVLEVALGSLSVSLVNVGLQRGDDE